MEKRLLSVIGPTAIGKTKLAITLARHFETEIISADSRQFYKEMCIGTAVPSQKELESATHHFIQHKSIFDSYSVGDFEREALSLLKELFKKNDTVVMVGGSGLYVDAVTKGLDKFPKIDSKIRVNLNADFVKKGISYLQDELLRLDPAYHSKVDLDNPHRLIRALEVCIGSGQPYSSFLKKEKIKRPFEVTTILINADREVIYNRINKRVEIMLSEGLLNEAKSLLTHRKLNALQTVGYKELFAYFDGDYTIEEATEEIKKNTRRFAKRQLTWFKKNTKAIWVDYDEQLEDVLNKLKKHITN